jgi:hypothetical protein
MAMGLRDNAIVAYAETKVMDKSDRDVWVLSGEILEGLLDKTGIDKNEIDGLVMAGLSGTGAGNPFWAQTTADVLGLEVGFCEQVHIGGCSAAGSCCSPTPTCWRTIPTTATPTAANGPTLMV